MTTSTPTQAPISIEHTEQAAHVPFSWLPGKLECDDNAQFVALTMDICQGIDVCLELVYASELDRYSNRDADPGDEAVPTLSHNHADQLLRLAMTSARLLVGYAQRRIFRMNTRKPE